MKKEDLIKREKMDALDVLQCADTQASSLSSQVVERQAIDITRSEEAINDQKNNTEDVSEDSSYILDLLTSLDKQGMKLTTSQSEVQSLLGETNALMSEYNMSVKVMKDKLEDREIKLRKSKA
jgi:hypothetical protein